MEKNKHINYLKRAASYNTALIVVFLVWVLFSVFEMVRVIRDALDGVLEYYYHLPVILGMNKAVLTLYLSVLFAILSFLFTIVLLINGLKADKKRSFGSGFYYLIMLINIATIGYFVANAVLTKKTPDVKSIIFIVGSLVSLILSMLIVVNLSKITHRSDMLASKYEDELDELDDYDEIVDERDTMYVQDPQQFDAVVNNHDQLSEDATRNLFNEEDLIKTQTFSSDNNVDNNNTITVDIEQLKKEMDAANFKSDEISEDDFVQIDNSVKYSPVSEMKLDDKIDFVENPSENETIIKPKSNLEERFKGFDLEVEPTKSEGIVDLRDKKATKSEELEATEFEEFSMNTETKVLAMPGDPNKVIVITKTYKAGKLINETSEIKNKSEIVK